jgi:hypothetical protein
MKLNFLFVLFATVFLTSCATYVASRADLKKYEDGGIGFVAFSYSSEDQGAVELEVENMDLGKAFDFTISKPTPNSIDWTVGPIVIYNQYLSEDKVPPLTLIPLPAGRYFLHYLRYDAPVRIEALNLFQPTGGQEVTSSLDKEHFDITSGKTTYIGSYTGTMTRKFLWIQSMDYDVADELESRAQEMNITDSIKKEICRIVN